MNSLTAFPYCYHGGALLVEMKVNNADANAHSPVNHACFLRRPIQSETRKEPPILRNQSLITGRIWRGTRQNPQQHRYRRPEQSRHTRYR